MSLKKSIRKLIAGFAATMILNSNCYMFGIGMSKVIAQDIKEPNINLNVENMQYVQFKEKIEETEKDNTEYHSGVAIKTRIQIGLEEQETQLPIKGSGVVVTMPVLNGYLPERATVVDADTILTTGEKNNNKINQNYDSNSGLLSVSYQNEESYSNYNKESKDEFEIIYIYPAKAYVENENEIKLQYNVSAKINFETENNSLFSELVKGFELKEKDNKGYLTTFGDTELENNIYKGFMYSNVENETNYDTDYNTISTLCVLNSNVTNNLTMQIEENKFVLNDKEKTEILTNGKVLYKSTQINKAEFDRILGQDGALEIYSGEELQATLKYIEVSENEELVKRLAIIYSDENIKILSSEEDIAKVEYKEGIKSLTIKTTKPIAEGYINFKNQNIIKGSKDYIVDVEQLNSIKTTSVINNKKDNVELLLLEPETKISLNSSNINFSTLQLSKTTLTINLDSTNASTKLFSNPTITIKLPDGLNRAELSSPEIVNGNGLKIKNTKVKNNIINIELAGTQTSYDLTNVSGGASIVMDIDNIDFNDTLPTHVDNIIVTCMQGNEQIKANKEVNIISKAGLLVLSKLKGFDNKNTVLTSIDGELKTTTIQRDSQAKQVVQTIDLVNNYNNKVSNIAIIGRLGYVSEELNSNFDLNLVKEIELQSGKVYYSKNINATFGDDSWTEEFTNEAKAYKIELNNKELDAKSNLGIKLYLNVPANLYYNQESYIKTDINYQYNDNNINDTSLIGMLTEQNNLANNSTGYSTMLMSDQGKNNQVSVIVTPNVTQNYVHSRQRVTYKIKVTNNGAQDLSNIVLEDKIPDNSIYTYIKKIDGNVADYTVIEKDETQKNIVWNIEKLKAGDSKECEIMLTMADVTEEQKIINSVVLKCGNQNITANNELTLKPAQIETNLITSAEGMIGVEYNVGENVVYCVEIKNIHNKSLNDVKVKFELPADLEFVEGGLASGDLTKGYTIEEQGNINNNVFEYNIKKLKENEEKVICIIGKVNQLKNSYTGDITAIAQTEINGDIYESNIKTITTKQSEYTVGLKSNIKEGTVLKKGNEVIYEIEVENKGAFSGSVMVKDNIPEQLKVKKIEEYVEGELKQSLVTSKKDIEWSIYLKTGEKGTLKIITEVDNIEVEEINNIEVVNTANIEYGTIKLTSNENKIVIQPELKVTEENDGYNPEEFKKEEKPGEETKPGEDIKPGEDTKLYSISGDVWLDLNKDGIKDLEESTQQDIKVTLINMAIGDFATDETGNKITATTDVQGKYTFNNLKEGLYAVMFEFDTQNYTVTTYQKEQLNENQNSDAILSTVDINGEKKVVALTDKIKLTSNKENIDLGLIENAIFDLSLNKQIVDITVVDKKGTETYEYEDGHTAKVDLVAKYMNGANVIVKYRFTIENNGEVAGYVNVLKDSLPSGLEFSSELNNDWYKDTDGNLYTTALAGTVIRPGESIDIDLVLNKTMTEENAGTFVNSAEIEKISNLENIEEKEEAKENNVSSAILIISIKTGSVILYIGITTLCLAIISIGIYFIKKKVLMREI